MNMSYCRFQNTLTDLRDCADALDKILDANPEDGDENDEQLSAEEQQAAVALIETCARITAQAIEKIRRPGPRGLEAEDFLDRGKREELKLLVAGQPVHYEE